ncbi:Fic family protein [Francisella philomiragia]|uniref:Fic family protein n=1 Tax=Francisella philomiragia TaxID=28110 RepID=UPI00396730CC
MFIHLYKRLYLIGFAIARSIGLYSCYDKRYYPPSHTACYPQVKELLKVLGTLELSRQEIQDKLGLKDRKSFADRYLNPALEQGFIEMTIPHKPKSRLQKYRKK